MVKTIVIAGIVAATLANLWLGAFSFLKARSRGRYYSLPALFAGGALYAACYVVELLRPDLDGVLACLGFEYLGIQTMMLSLVFLAREFKGKEGIRPLALLALATIPVVTVVLGFTVSSHELLYVDPYVESIHGLTVVRFGMGPWYWVNVLFVYGVYAYAGVEFARILIRSASMRKAQARLMLAGCAVPFAESILYLAGLTPGGIELSPVAFALSGAFLASGIFRYGLFDVRPIARDAVFEHMHDAAIVVDADGFIADANRTARGLFPRLDEDGSCLPLSELGSAYPELARLPAPGTLADTASLRLRVGEEERAFDVQASNISGRSGRNRGSVILLYDVTERERLQACLIEQASTDDLTRVANRRRFYEVAEAELERAGRHGRPIGFAILDMNGFKDINDGYGHQAGDDALRLVARLCVGELRSCDLVGRVGGDEFAFVLPESDEEGAAAAAGKLRRLVGAATLTVGTATVRLSAAVGSVGCSGPVYPDLAELLTIADRRMYADKPRFAAVKANKAAKTAAPR
ncbi:MAG TPA: histidine kinase N-terminal 7TM domain-containing protein [Spirochaetales bacterium]|mgnify:FL=1|nr:histidine kinase N-terminal 7TM domain-containing protein [Spirochaetales bacterium]